MMTTEPEASVPKCIKCCTGKLWGQKEIGLLLISIVHFRHCTISKFATTCQLNLINLQLSTRVLVYCKVRVSVRIILAKSYLVSRVSVEEHQNKV